MTSRHGLALARIQRCATLTAIITATAHHSRAPSTTISLADLPIELLHRICAHSEGVCSFRAVCSAMAVVGAEYLLPCMSLYFVRESFEKIQQVAQSTDMAKGVKVLSFHADRLAPLTYAEWDRKREDSNPSAHKEHLSTLTLQSKSPTTTSHHCRERERGGE